MLVNRRALLVVLASVEALLLGRLVALLLAARPNNPAVVWLYRLSEPLRLPLRVLDQGQPGFGARLEFSTLAAAVIVLVGGYLAWLALSRAAGSKRNKA